MMNSLIDAAVDLASAGFAIFPLAPRTKVPMIEGGHNSADSEDIEGIIEFWTEHPEANIGIATGAKSGGLLVIDLDESETKSGSDALYDWEGEHGKLPETACVTTPSGGMHLYYRTDKTVRISRNGEMGVDIRADGGYVVAPPSVHPNGGSYEWDLHYDEYPIAEADENVLAFVKHVQPQEVECGEGGEGSSRYEFPAVVYDGQGRDDHLFKYASSLRTGGCEFAQIMSELRKVNAERVKPPKSERDLRRIATSACRKKKGLSPEYQRKRDERIEREAAELERQIKEFSPIAEPANAKHEPEKAVANFINKRGILLFEEVAQDMVENRHGCMVGDVPAIWGGDAYIMGWQAFENEVRSYKRNTTRNERAEVKAAFECLAPKVKSAARRYIAFSNGILNIDTMQIERPSPELIIHAVVPHRWNPDARYDAYDAMVRKIACDDSRVIANIHEMLGLSIYRGHEIPCIFILQNETGSNGKSTLLDAFRFYIGDENCTAIDPQILAGHFISTALIGKLANIADDIPASDITTKAASFMKRIATGNATHYEIKNGPSGSFYPCCTQIYSMNEVPETEDTSGGYERRYFAVPFNARFSKSDPDYDPCIKDKLLTEECAEYALLCAVNALKAALDRRDVTENGYSKQSSDAMILESNSVFGFLDEKGYESADDVIGYKTSDLYNDYRIWSENFGYPPSKIKKRSSFTKDVCTRLGVNASRIRSGNIRYYIFESEEE